MGRGQSIVVCSGGFTGNEKSFSMWTLELGSDRQWNWFTHPCSINCPTDRILIEGDVVRVTNSIFVFGGFTVESFDEGRFSPAFSGV